MKVGFTGSRNYPWFNHVETFVSKLAEKYPDVTVVSGGRGNVDVTAEMTAVDHRLAVVSYRPTDNGIEIWKNETGWRDLKKVGDMAGRSTFVLNCFFRNQFIAACDQVVGFWDGSSRGTADTLKTALSIHQHTGGVFVYDLDGNLIPTAELELLLLRALS